VKKTVLVFLVIAFLFNCIGGYLLFFILQKGIHEENWTFNTSKENLEQLTVINLTGEVFRINAHEIVYKGKLYDIVAVKQNKKGTKYVCRQDRKEESLQNRFLKTQILPAKNKGFRKLVLKSILEFVVPRSLQINNSKFELTNYSHDKIASLESHLSPPYSPPDL
jgi:hypothetical protein